MSACHVPCAVAVCGPRYGAKKSVKLRDYLPKVATDQPLVYASRAVQFHPDGGQFGFVWLSARTMHPHGGASYVW